MEIKRMKIVSILTISCVILLIGGCAKNEITVNLGQGTGSEEPEGDKTSTLVTFNASIEGRNMSRALSPMRPGIQSQLYAYSSSDAQRSTPDATGLYITTSPGVLSGVDGYKMFLSNGIYNFYAVSDNFSTIPPKFTAGISEPLFNGIDYLWWHNTQQDVASSQINIPIVYLHSATQIVFNVEAGDGIKLNKLVSAMITPPEPGATMNLGTGVITPTTTYGKADKMGINGFTTQYIMLPLTTTTPMTLTLEIMADGENFSRNYTVDVPVPDGALKAGNSYLFDALIDGNTVTFPNVSIKEWTEVDETGNPLYPIQK